MVVSDGGERNPATALIARNLYLGRVAHVFGTTYQAVYHEHQAQNKHRWDRMLPAPQSLENMARDFAEADMHYAMNPDSFSWKRLLWSLIEKTVDQNASLLDDYIKARGINAALASKSMHYGWGIDHRQQEIGEALSVLFDVLRAFPEDEWGSIVSLMRALLGRKGTSVSIEHCQDGHMNVHLEAARLAVVS